MLSEISNFIKISKVFFKYKLYRLNKFNKQELNSSKAKDKLLSTDLKLALEELGPLYIKLGQLLSSRHDLLPPDFIKELSELQDNVKPFNSSIVKEIIKTELKQDYNTLFPKFIEKSLAAASVAQVHEAELTSGDRVIIKVLRPDLKQHVDQNLKSLRLFIKILLLLKPDLKRFKLTELGDELERVLKDEQDLLREAANASQLKRNFSNSKLMYVPKVYWQYCTKNILVLEKINGISINNIKLLQDNKIDLKYLAKSGVELFFIQVFEHCFFHGDMHPGNILVNVDKFSKYKVPFYAVDFGIMGTLGPVEQHYLAHNLWAFVNRDYRRIAQLHIESGWVRSDTRVDVFESAIRAVSEPILEKPIADISFGELLVRLFDVAREFDMQLQPQLLLFKKALINVEGIAKQLDPDLDLWTAARPHIEKFIKSRIGFDYFMSNLKDFAPKLMSTIHEIPEVIYKYLKDFEKNIKNTSHTNSEKFSNVN